jgi:hypothetical protein
MQLAELLEREAIADADQLLDWARQRAATVIAELAAEDSLRSLLEPGGEAGIDEVPIARRRRREPSSPQPKTAAELPPLPDHPRLADGEPEPMLEHVDTGPIDLEDEIVRRRIREDSWTLGAREVQAFVAERHAEPVVERHRVDVEPEAPIEPRVEADSDALALRSFQTSEPELPVVVRPAESPDDPIEGLALPDAEDEFEVDELDELEVDELVELDEEVDENEGEDADEPSAAKPPPPPPKSGPPPIRNEVADMIASLSEPVRTGDTATIAIDQVEGTPAPAKPDPDPDDDDGIDIDVD